MRAFHVLLSLISLAIILFTFLMARHGIDRTDEGYYLNAIRHPGDDVGPVSLFGYAYAPVYSFIDGDIVWLRWIGIALTLVVALGAAWAVLGIKDLVGTQEKGQRAVLSGLVALAALYPLVGAPSTPNYNTLALQGLLLAAAGLALARFAGRAQVLGGWTLIGIGGAITFLGKPTTAAALLLGLLVFAALTFGRWLIRLPVAVVVATLVLVLMTQQSPMALMERLLLGFETNRLLGGHGLRRMLGLYLPHVLPGPLVAAALTMVLAAAAMVLLQRGRRFTGSTALVGAALAAAAAIPGLKRGNDGGAVMLGATAMVGLLALSTLGAGGSEPDPPKSEPRTARARVAYLLLLMALPFAYALGTNNEFLASAGRGSALWVLAVTIMLSSRSAFLSLAPGLAAALLLASHLVATALNPYRYPSVLEADTLATVSPSGAQVRLTSADAQRTTEFNELVSDLNIDGDTWILDLTGEAPGYVHQAGAHSVGKAWLLGGYPGSSEMASRSIDHNPCHLQDAFVFYAPNGSRAIHPSVLHPYGISLEDDYELVGTFARLASWTSSPNTVESTQILRPTSPLEVAGCP